MSSARKALRMTGRVLLAIVAAPGWLGERMRTRSGYMATSYLEDRAEDARLRQEEIRRNAERRDRAP